MKDLVMCIEALVLAKQGFITEDGIMYCYTIAGKVSQGKGIRPKNELIDIFSKELIEVGTVIPITYDCIEKKYKLNRAMYKDLVSNKKKTTLEKIEEEKTGLIDEEPLPFY